MLPLDTKFEVQKKYDELWQKLPVQERFLKGLKLIHLSRQMLIAGFKARFPGLSQEELRKIIVKQIYHS